MLARKARDFVLLERLPEKRAGGCCWCSGGAAMVRPVALQALTVLRLHAKRPRLCAAARSADGAEADLHACLHPRFSNALAQTKAL